MGATGQDQHKGPLVIALGSGSGGVGRTTTVLELARCFERRSLSTVLVDGSVYVPILAPARGWESGPTRRDLFADEGHLADWIERDEDNGLGILTLAACVTRPERIAERSGARFVERLRRLDDAVVLVDLPAGPVPFWIDVFCHADVPIVVSGPEAWSVRALVPFVERVQACAGERPPRTYLMLSGCRDPSERELGEVLCHAVWRKLGLYPRYLGPIDHDDRRWFHLRHGDACPPLSSSEGLGVQAEEIAKRILSLEEFDESRPRPAGGKDRSAGWLGLSHASSAADLRAQYRRLWEGYRRESALSQVVLDDGERKRLIAEVEQTYRALQVALDEGRVPESGPQPAVESSPEATSEPEGRAQDVAAWPASGQDHDSGGQLVRCRQARNMSLRELSLRTRIGLRYLEAIEAMDVDALPPPVYLRGYLREIARVLELPVESLLDRYLSELAEIRRGTSSGVPGVT